MVIPAGTTKANKNGPKSQLDCTASPNIFQELTPKVYSQNHISLSDFEAHPQWCIWKNEQGRKVPYDAATLKPAKSNDPATWHRHKRAKVAAPKVDGGIGLMLGHVQGLPNVYLGGIDLDTCRNPKTGNIEAWATEIIDRLESYCEISPSGTGVKIFLLHDGSTTQSFTFKNKGQKHPPAIEGYFEGRYFTVTGQEVLDPEDPVDGKRPLRLLKPDARQWLMEVAGPRLIGQSPNTPNETTSGRSEALIAFACDYTRDGKTKEQFQAAIDEGEECPDGSAHVADQKDQQRAIDRAWAEALNRNPAIEFEDLTGDDDSAIQLKSTLNFYGPSEIGAIPEAHDFIEGLFYEKKVSVVYGAPGSGKTFVLLDIAAHAVLGKSWQGCQVDKTKVLYIALEGASGMKCRRDAWCKHNGINDPNSLPLYFADGSLDIRKGKATRKAIAEFAKAHDIKWIIIDTLSRAMAGGEESGAADMGAAFLGADEVSRLCGAHVTLVHHSGKDESKGGRGSSLLLGNIDTELHVTRNGDNRGLRVSKQKEGQDGEQWQFKLETLELGYNNRRGKAVTSCVAVFGADVDFPIDDGLTVREREAFEILKGLSENSQSFDKDDNPLVPRSVFMEALKVHKWINPELSKSGRSMAFKRLCSHFDVNHNILIYNDNIVVHK